jgi:solute carrier family 6 GABA transporter-like protein 1
VDYKPITYGKSYKYPPWAESLGFCMSFSSMIWVPAYAIYYILATPGSLKEVGKFFVTL